MKPPIAFVCALFALLSISSGHSQQSAAPSHAAPIAAASPAYTVEVIVFRTLGSVGTSEDWAAEDRRAISSTEEDTPAPSSAAVGAARLVNALPATEFKLAEIETKLRASGGYSVLAHAAWQQTPSPWGSKLGFPLDKLGLAAAGLSGSIALERGQYLHLGVDLNYSPSASPGGLAAGGGTVYVLNESRRVKFFERNYFDHPAFGVIALVTPVQGARPAGR